MRIHLITHTHWDREWYRTYEEFRIYLVELLNRLFEHFAHHPEYRYFILDGQVVLLEDYLQVRPDQKAILKKWIQSGRLIIGPMYTQPDEYIPSAESLVRNFLIGGQICDEYGRKMPIGFFPDSFGQASQIPQILNGFGIDKAVFWRGVCDHDTSKTEFFWESRDGSRVHTVWMPYSYGNAYTMPNVEEGALEFIHKAIDLLGPLATTDQILLLSGWDHSGFNPTINSIVEQINPQLKKEGHEIIHSNLELLFSDILKKKPQMQTLKGEFRKAKTMRIHPGIDSTRMDLKQLNRLSQNQLEKFIEPLYSFLWLNGREYPQPMINHAWKYILQSQAHDSICGCCTDEVARDIRARFQNTLQIEKALLKNGTSEFSELLRTNAQPGLPIVVINTLPFERSETVQCEVVVPYDRFKLVSGNGEEICYQIVSKEKINLGVDPSTEAIRASAELVKKDLLKEVGKRPDEPAIYYSSNAYVPLAPRAKGIPGFRLVIAFPAMNVPAFSFKSFYLQENQKAIQKPSMQSGSDFIENEFLKIIFHRNGSFDLLEKEHGFFYRNLHVFRDTGDAGDTYNYSPPEKDECFESLNSQARIKIQESGSCMLEANVKIAMQVPSGLSIDGKTRTEQKKRIQIESRISLTGRSKFVSIHTRIANTAKDHRMQVLFPCGIKSRFSFAEEQFGVIQRPNKREEEKYWIKEGWTEKPLAIYPQQTFVDVHNEKQGLAILNRNITEYEVIGDNQSVIAITLFHGIGAMGRPNLVVRPGRASGLEIETPEALLLGQLEFDYAIFPHAGKFDEVTQQANIFNAPMLTVMADRHVGVLEPDDCSIAISPSTLNFSCLKKAEKEDALILRVYNSAPDPVNNGSIKLGKYFQNIQIVSLEELPQKKAIKRMDDNCWVLPEVKSSQALTIKIEPKNRERK